MKLVKNVLLLLIGLIIISPSAMAMDFSSPGMEFGQHISSMMPDCPIMHGDMFGEMVSSMARGLSCPMHSQ